MPKLLIITFIFLFSFNLRAEDDWGMWLSNTYQTDFGGRDFLAFLELAPRLKNDNRDFQQIIVRPLLGYKLSKELSAWLGYTWQGEYTKARTDKFSLATHDIVEQLQWVHDINEHVNFQYRLRFEQRLFADADVGHRVRHRLRLTYTIPETSVYLIGLDELFIYFNSLNNSDRASSVQQGINQNRSYAGVGYKFNSNVQVDTGYQLQYVNNFGKDDLYNHVWLTNVNIRF